MCDYCRIRWLLIMIDAIITQANKLHSENFLQNIPILYGITRSTPTNYFNDMKLSVKSTHSDLDKISSTVAGAAFLITPIIHTSFRI